MISKKNINAITNKVLEDIKPDSDSLIIANDFVAKLNSLLEKNDLKAVAVLGGSMAKNTFLKGDYDADIFVKFDFSYKGKDISGLLERVLKKFFVYERIKGSRDYFHIRKEFTFEIVPVLKVSSINDADNVIDMSPMHVDYFKSKGSGLENEVRLLKRFMKSARVYGSESFIRGFSGHVLDLLVLKYGGFIDVLKVASSWKAPVVIDLEKKLKNPLFELDKAKVSGPLIVVDPVQENRNAAAALSIDFFNRFVIACNNFLKFPDTSFFEIKSAKNVISKHVDFNNGKLFEFVIFPLDGSDDVSGSKVLKIIEFFVLELKKHDFVLFSFEWDFNHPSNVFFLVDDEVLNETKVVRGPPTSEVVHCDAFRAKHSIVFEQNNFLFAKVKRNFVDVLSLFKSLVINGYVSERCKRIEIKDY